jgi:hypothetical protein
VAREAKRRVSIFTHDLEPGIYDDADFLEVIKRLVLSQAYARIRVLIADPTRAIKNGNNFVHLGRRLNTYLEVRHEPLSDSFAKQVADSSRKPNHHRPPRIQDEVRSHYKGNIRNTDKLQDRRLNVYS